MYVYRYPYLYVMSAQMYGSSIFLSFRVCVYTSKGMFVDGSKVVRQGILELLCAVVTCDYESHRMFDPANLPSSHIIFAPLTFYYSPSHLSPFFIFFPSFSSILLSPPPSHCSWRITQQTPIRTIDFAAVVCSWSALVAYFLFPLSIWSNSR